MVYNVVHHFPELQPVEPRHCGAHANEHWAFFGGLDKSKVVQTVQISLRDGMVALIDEDELELAGVELGDPVAGGNGLYGGNGDIGGPGSLGARHLDLDTHVRVVLLAVSRGLLDELLAVDEDEGLGRVWGGGMSDTLDQLGENDSLATARGQRDTHSAVAQLDVMQNGLDAVLLVVTQLEGGRGGGGGQRTEGAQRRRTRLPEGPGERGKGATDCTHV